MVTFGRRNALERSHFNIMRLSACLPSVHTELNNY